MSHHVSFKESGRLVMTAHIHTLRKYLYVLHPYRDIPNQQNKKINNKSIIILKNRSHYIVTYNSMINF